MEKPTDNRAEYNVFYSRKLPALEQVEPKIGMTGDDLSRRTGQNHNIYTGLMNESPPNSGQNALYNPLGHDLIYSAKPRIPVPQMGVWDRKKSEDRGSLLIENSIEKQRKKDHNVSKSSQPPFMGTNFPPTLLQPNARFLTRNQMKGRTLAGNNLITRDYSPNTTMPPVLNTSIKGASIEKTTLGNELAIMKLKEQVKLLKEEVKQLTDLNFKLCDQNEALQEENEALGGGGNVKDDLFNQPSVGQATQQGSPHKFESPQARERYFQKRNAHNKASLKVKSILTQTALQNERRMYKQRLQEVMEQSSEAVEEMRQTLCKENDDTLEMLADATRKMLQLEQEKSIAMANLAFIKQQFQRFAANAQRKPIKKNPLSGKRPMSTEGGESKVEEEEDDEEEQDVEEILEELRATIKSLEADKQEMQAEKQDLIAEMAQKDKMITEYQNKYNEVDIDSLHEQINAHKSKIDILEREIQALQNPVNEENEEGESEEEDENVVPPQEKPADAPGDQESKELKKTKKMGEKYIDDN